MHALRACGAETSGQKHIGSRLSIFVLAKRLWHACVSCSPPNPLRLWKFRLNPQPYSLEPNPSRLWKLRPHRLPLVEGPGSSHVFPFPSTSPLRISPLPFRVPPLSRQTAPVFVSLFEAAASKRSPAPKASMEWIVWENWLL